jgi:hypothetical protein
MVKIKFVSRSKKMSTVVMRKVYQLPSEGPHSAILIDVIDEGIRDFGYGPKDCLKLVFGIGDETGENNEPLTVSTICGKFNSPKATLFPFLKLFYAGRDIPDVIDVGEFIGINCRLNIVHSVKKDGRTFANIKGVFAPLPGAPKLLIPASYKCMVPRDEPSAAVKTGATVSVPVVAQPAPVPDVTAKKPVQSASTSDEELKANIAGFRAKSKTAFTTATGTTASAEEADPRMPF